MTTRNRNPLNTVGLLAFAIAFVLVCLFLFSSVKSFVDIRFWQRDAVSSQVTLLNSVARIESGQRELAIALSNVGSELTAAARDSLVAQLDGLASELSGVLSTGFHPLIEKTASPVPGTENGKEAEGLLPLLGQLESAATPLAASLEQVTLKLQMGDPVSIGTLNNELSALATPLNAFRDGLRQHNVALNAAIVESNTLMTSRLLAAAAALAAGGVLAIAPALVFVQRKRNALRVLQTSNSQLVDKVEEAEHRVSILSHHARHDGLTNLLNRSGFNDVLEGLLEEGKGRHGLCFIDLDLFKIVNDTSGHAAGDHLLKRVAGVLKSHLPKRGHAIRLGGDEFLILAPYTTDERFKELVQSCLEELNPLRIEYDGQNFEVTASFGATYFDATEHTSDTVMSIVDAACYEAKNAGGGRVQFHSGKEGAVEDRKTDMMWVAKIRESLENKRMQLHYQNIVEAKAQGDTVHSMEILVRMLDDNGKIQSPGMFLDIAERFSLAPRIDKFVIENTFKWLRQGQLGAQNDSLVNINLSGRSIGDAEVLSFIESISGKYNTPSSRVCLEITETAAVGKNARDFLIQLHDMGFKLALDDFGSGFSSFGYLESLPVDYIKIDGMFVRDLETNHAHREFIRAIDRVGKAMGKLTVAEFVENQASLDLLEEMGVDFAQGYHIHKPQELVKSTLMSDFSDFKFAA